MFTGADSIETAEQTEGSLASLVQEHTIPGVAGASDALQDILENDSIISQFLAESYTAVTSIDCLPLNFLDDGDEITKEIESNRSVNNDLPVSVEAGDTDAETGCPLELQGTSFPALNGTFTSTGEVEKSQQSELSVNDAVDDEDLITTVSDDSTKPEEMVLDDGNVYTCTKNNSRPVEYCLTENVLSSSQEAVITNEQNFKQDMTYIDAERSAVCDELPSPINYNGILQMDTQNETFMSTNEVEQNRAELPSPIIYNGFSQWETQNEQQVSINLSSAASSMTDGIISHTIDVSSNSAESVDVMCSFSSLVQCSSEAEDVDTSTQLQPKDKDSPKLDNGDDAAVACSMKETLSEVNDNMLLPANDISVSMEVDEDDIQNEQQVSTSLSNAASSVTDGSIKRVIDGSINIEELVDSVHSSSSMVQRSSEAESIGMQLQPKDKESSLQPDDDDVAVACSMEETLTNKNDKILPANDIPGNMELDEDDVCVELSSESDSHSHNSQLIVQVESAVEPVKLSTDASEILDAAIIVPDTANTSDQILEIDCEEVTALSPERSATKQDTSETDTANDEDVNDDDANSSLVCEVISSTADDSRKEDVILLSSNEVTSETTNHTSSVNLVSSVSSTVTNDVLKTVEPESHTQTSGPSCIVILKNSASSTQPSNMSIPHSSSAVLSNTSQRTALTATSIYQFPQYVMPSVKEAKSTSTINYRPAAALVMNVGKNLVTEFVFREIVDHADKWKSASDPEKVPLNS